MAISDADTKLLWGRAAGKCSNPDCEQDLTELIETGDGFNIGEMAHLVAKKPDGPRGVPGGGDDTYANLILLCPSCHRRIDKAPDGQYPVKMLLEWKSTHEQRIRNTGRGAKFQSREQLFKAVVRLLAENGAIWRDLGPSSDTALEDAGSNLYKLWNLRKLDRIVPNNTKVINMIESNADFLSSNEWEVFCKFRTHAGAFESNQYHRLDSYPLYPQEFEEIFKS
ncbi:MAG: HNH endonuclease [Gammaproteobacteria bacterium]|nr:HNH endonuclease [Gammaproteobacteria bacterium]